MAEQQKPLWRVMQDAFTDATIMHGYGRHGYAAELRAIADVVVPEEPKPDLYIGTDMGWMVNAPATYKWEQRMATRALLLAEAERAEKGDANG
jgi:hypothetical protein